MSSIFRRALRVAQSNISDIRDRAASIGRSGGKSLEDMSDSELEAELERRRRDHATRAAVDRARKNAADRAGDAHDDEASPKKSSERTSFYGDENLDLSDLSPQRRREIRQYYANLELPFGADLEAVKHSFRRLMSQYHPDKHQNDPARKQLATQLSQKLTVAFNELSKLLKDKQKKS